MEDFPLEGNRLFFLGHVDFRKGWERNQLLVEGYRFYFLLALMACQRDTNSRFSPPIERSGGFDKGKISSLGFYF